MTRRNRSEARCRGCALIDDFCLCAEIPVVPTRTRIIVVRHVRELAKPSGTARVAARALPALELLDYRDERGAAEPPWMAGAAEDRPILPPEAVGERLAALDDAALLFPTGKPLDGTRAPRTLVVLDGTWRQVRAMYQRIPGSARLPALRLTDEAAPVIRLRTPRRPGERSTLEAIADALQLLEGDGVARPLRALHARFVAQNQALRGR